MGGFRYVSALLFVTCGVGCSKSKPSDDDAPVRKSEATTAAAPAAPSTSAAASTGAAASKLACRALTVQSAKDARGAPLWSSSSDLLSHSNKKGAPGHVPAGQAVKAACANRLGAGGIAVCVKSQAGEVGWMHHERLLKAGNPGSSLAAIEGLGACADDVCRAGECE